MQPNKMKGHLRQTFVICLQIKSKFPDLLEPS